MGGGVGIAGERADPVHGAAFVQAAVVAVEQVVPGPEQLEDPSARPGGLEAVIAADAVSFSNWPGMAWPRPCAASIVFATSSDFSRPTGAPSLWAPISKKTWLAV